jgi:hypothetical protein
MGKLLSRKLWVTVGALVATLGDLGLDTTHTIVTGAVACIYVIAQSFVDRAEVEKVAKSIERGLAEARASNRGDA